mgnify:CR=1 FL=1
MSVYIVCVCPNRTFMGTFHLQNGKPSRLCWSQRHMLRRANLDVHASTAPRMALYHTAMYKLYACIALLRGCPALRIFADFTASTSVHTQGFVYDNNIQKHEWDKMYNAEDGTGGRFYLGTSAVTLAPSAPAPGGSVCLVAMPRLTAALHHAFSAQALAASSAFRFPVMCSAFYLGMKMGPRLGEFRRAAAARCAPTGPCLNLSTTHPSHMCSIIIAKSVEGIDISIACSVLYQLRREPTGLRTLFNRFGGLVEQDPAEAVEEDEPQYGWTPFFVQSIRGGLRDVMGRFNATSLWKDRAGLRAAMRAEIAPFLEANHAELRGFQLLNMDIPSSLSDAILSTTVEGERVLRASTELISINETVITQVQVQARLAQLQLLTAQAEAVELNTASQADADALRLNVEAEAQAVQQLKT